MRIFPTGSNKSDTMETFCSFFVSSVKYVSTFAALDNDMTEKEQELFTKVGQLFLRFGIRSMTMDDISRQLGISKKTLYQFVSDKNDLVQKVMDNVVDQQVGSASALCEKYENAIDLIFELSRSINERFRAIHPSIHYDLEKYHPDAWETFNRFKSEFVTNCIEQNLRLGIEQGLYRGNLDPYIISRIYSAKMEIVFAGHLFNPDKYDFQTIYLEMMRYHIRGVASEEGLKYMKEKIKKEGYDL